MSSPTAAPVVSPARTMIYLGMDVHKDSVTIAVLPADASAPTRIDQYPNWARARGASTAREDCQSWRVTREFDIYGASWASP